MDLSTLTQIVSGVGFPIVACYYLYRMLQQLSDDQSKQLDKLSTAIVNNTIVMTRICEKLDIDDPPVEATNSRGLKKSSAGIQEGDIEWQ